MQTSEPTLSHFELLTLMARFEEVNLIATGLGVTIVSGFLVMAYTIGDKLTRRQLLLVVPLFIAALSMVGFATIGYGALSEYYTPTNYYAPDREPFALINTQNLFATSNIGIGVGVVVIIGCLLFLRDVRRSAAKVEDEMPGEATGEAAAAPAIAEEAAAEHIEPAEPITPVAPAEEDDHPETGEPK